MSNIHPLRIHCLLSPNQRHISQTSARLPPQTRCFSFSGRPVPISLRRNVDLLPRAEDEARGSSLSTQESSQPPECTPSSEACDPLCSVDETSLQDSEPSYYSKIDLLKALSVFAAAATGAVAINHSWVAANQAPSTDVALSELSHATSEISEILFFLLGAMTIVEIVDAHQGFKLVTDNITTASQNICFGRLVGFLTFFLSSILDNLTTTIVMVSLLRRLTPPSEYRKLLGAAVVIAANAGGAWTPIGDVTTTMLWIHGQITTLPTMKGLFLPSSISLAVPLALMSLASEVNGKEHNPAEDVLATEKMAPQGQLVLFVGIGALVFVPVFKALTGLPPYIGMLLGLGVLWILTDAIHYGESERQHLKLPQALSRIDTQGILFFLGILLSVSSLEAAGILREVANYLDTHVQNVELIASAVGVVSAIIDNVPLVAATMGMYDLSSFPKDSEFWQLVAYCAGTGGSMLIIGSAAGVAFMGMERVDFFWYLRKVSGFAFAGYAAGIAAYLAAHNLNLSEVPFIPGS